MPKRSDVSELKQRQAEESAGRRKVPRRGPGAPTAAGHSPWPEHGAGLRKAVLSHGGI